MFCDEEVNEQCQAARTRGYALLDSTTDFLKSFQYHEFGLEVGYESDQQFEASQTALGAFVYSQYEAWSNSGFLGALNITPAVRLGIDQIDPNDETPRAMAGDDSSFLRASGEVSLWVPLPTDQPLALTVSYRHYREISASSVVKDANLDSYNVRTIGLTGPFGLFVTYSSGQLPLDLHSDNVVALGWRTFF